MILSHRNYTGIKVAQITPAPLTSPGIMNIILSVVKLISVSMDTFCMEVWVMEYTITFSCDNEADVWIATSDDIPGLVLESGSFDALLERTRFAVPELLALNLSESQPLSLTFKSERRERMIL